jgi:hypothetical protein
MKRNIFVLLIVASILIIFSTLIIASGAIEENLPSLIRRIKPSTVIIYTYDDKGESLKQGSGFFINQNGDVVTNYHVIQGASSAEIKTTDGNTYPITYILAGDEQSDLIRLSVNISSKYVYPLSLNKTIPEIGESIIVYGSPLGLENTVSDGIVSAIRDIPNYGRIIQITAPISPGSSGSPVLNMKGEVIGIATLQMVEGQNLNFAIPSERIASFILTKGNKISIPEEMFEQGSKINNDLDYGEIMQIAAHFLNNEEYEKGILYLEIAVTKIDIFYLEIAPTKIDILSQKGYRYVDIGYCFEKLGNYFKAMEAYKQAIYFIPDDAYAHFGLGVSYSKIGDKNSALNEYKILKEIDIDLANELFDLIYE